MASTLITPDQDAIISEIDISAPPERVFKSLTDAAEIRRRSPELSAYEMDPRVGGKWYLEMRPPQPYKGFDLIRHDGEILELDPPRLLVYTSGQPTSTTIPSVARLFVGNSLQPSQARTSSSPTVALLQNHSPARTTRADGPECSQS